MVAPTTRLRLRVAPGSASPGVAVPPANATLVSGSGSRNKIVELTGTAPDEIERRLATAGGQETG